MNSVIGEFDSLNLYQSYAVTSRLTCEAVYYVNYNQLDSDSPIIPMQYGHSY